MASTDPKQRIKDAGLEALEARAQKSGYHIIFVGIGGIDLEYVGEKAFFRTLPGADHRYLQSIEQIMSFLDMVEFLIKNVPLYSLLVSHVGWVRQGEVSYEETKKLYNAYNDGKYAQVSMWCSLEDDPIEFEEHEGGLE